MKCTYRAAKLFKNNNQLKVHSTYRHTVNVMIDNHIFAFHQNVIPATPLSLSLPFSEEEFEKFETEAQRTGSVTLYRKDSEYQKKEPQSYWIKTGSFQKNTGELFLWEDELKEPVKKEIKTGISKKAERKKQENISGKTENIDKENTDKESIDKRRIDKESIEKTLSALLPVLSQNYQKGGFSDCAVTCEKRENDSFITGILRQKTVQILSEENDNDFENNICSLIGLGPGLTPSGDDFITGLLLAFSFCSFQENIRNKTEQKKQKICKVVSDNLDRTNDISREYLICAMENRFGELYHVLQKGFYHREVQKDIFYKIIHTGHSSGIDTLNGFAVGLQLAER